MLRKLVLMICVAGALLAQEGAQQAGSSSTPAQPAKVSALDKPTLEAWLRHLFVWPEQITVTISDPKPGPMSGFYEVEIRGTAGAQMQDDTFYVSTDGQKIVRGTVFDITQNPFKPENDKLKTQGRPAMGTAGAPVVIADFSDFECPYCKEEAKTLRDNLAKAYPEQVRLYFYDYPLTSIHPWAMDAAIAGRCVFRQSVSSFWAWHDWIFESQEGVSPDNFKDKVNEFAKTRGSDLDLSVLNSCMARRETEAEVNQSIQLGQSLGVNQTPTIFINGRRLPGAASWDNLKFVIDFEVGYQKTAKNAGEDCGCDVALPTFAGDKKETLKPPAAK
jgi:protein-disulfide isomerase